MIIVDLDYRTRLRILCLNHHFKQLMQDKCRRKVVSATQSSPLKTLDASKIRQVIAVSFAPSLELFALCNPCIKQRDQRFLDLAIYSPAGRLIREMHTDVHFYEDSHRCNLLLFLHSTTLLATDPYLVLFSSKSGKLIHKSSAKADCLSMCPSGEILTLSRSDSHICRYQLIDKGTRLKQIDSFKVPLSRAPIFNAVHEISHHRILFITATSLEVLGRIYIDKKQTSLVLRNTSCFFF